MLTATPRIQHLYTIGASKNRLHTIDFGGSGTPLLALHGVTGNAWNWWKVAEGLTDRRHVYGLDFRGFGESQWSGEGAYSTSDHVADVGTVITALGASSVDLIGSSWGALVALQYAVENPDRVGHLIIVDVEASFTQGETELHPRPTRYDSIADVVREEATRNPNATAEMIDLTVATGYTGGPGGALVPKHDPYFFTRWPFRSDDHWERLGHIQSPTLFLHGTKSFVRGEVMEKMTRRVHDGRLVEIHDSGHAVPLENPMGIVAEAGPFLDDES